MFYRKPLYYGFNKLEPFIDTATMDEHYNKHYKKYEENLNQALLENNIREDDIEVVLRNYSNNTKIRNNGGGFYNHLLYFDNVSTNCKVPIALTALLLSISFKTFIIF